MVFLYFVDFVTVEKASFVLFFGDFVTLEKVDFSFRKNSDFDIYKKKKLCVKCVDGLSLILLFQLL
jgi:hypothetical protein